MRGAIIRALLAVSLLSLSGCNIILSKEPWFTPADARDAPRLRDGLWVKTDDPHCRFRESKAAERWPECADMIVVRGEEWLALHGETKDGKVQYEWDALPVLIANGTPPILQIPPQGRDDSDDAAFMYAALRPVTFDENRKVTALELWIVQCGPLSEQGDPKRVDAGHHVTDRPFPGLTLTNSNCTADSVASLRNAAALSAPLDLHSTMHWVRDAWR